MNRSGAFALPFMTLWLTTRIGVSVQAAGLVVTTFGLASIVSRLLGGWLADRWTRRATMVTGLCCCAAALLAMAAARGLTQSAVAVVLLGLSFEIYEPPCQALIAESLPSARRPAAFGALGAALAVAAMVAGLLATALAPISLRLLFVADAASCLAAAVVVRHWVVEAPSLPRRVPQPGGRESPWRNPLLVRLFAANLVFAGCYLQVFVTLPLTLADRGLASGSLGLLLTVSALTFVAGQPLLKRLPRRLAQPRVAIVGGLAAVAVGFAGYAVAASLAEFAAATVVVALGDLVLMGHLVALVSDIAPSAQRGRYLAAYGLSWGVASTVAPVCGAWLLARYGDTAPWLASTALLVGLACYLPNALAGLDSSRSLAKEERTTKVDPV